MTKKNMFLSASFFGRASKPVIGTLGIIKTVVYSSVQ